MKISLIIIGIWSAILLFLSLAITGAFSCLYAGSFYTFTLPFTIIAGLLVVLSVTGIVFKRTRVVLFWIIIFLHGLLFLPFRFAMTRWPGGDDGPGMAWLICIGGGSYIAGLLAISLVVIRVWITLRKKRKNRTS